MPLPIWPAPITPILFSLAVIELPVRSVASIPQARPKRKRADGESPERSPSANRCRAFLQFLLQLRQDLEQVADETVIGDLEDRRLGVLVDGDDDARILHAGEVLDGARYAAGNVEVRRDDLAGLAD